MLTTVVLVDQDKERGVTLTRYLEASGFSARHVEAQTPELDNSTSMVWLVAEHVNERLIADSTRSWLGVRSARALIVCAQPARLAVEVDDVRAWFLAAPVRGWQLVNALREVRSMFASRSSPLHRHRHRRRIGP